MKSALTDLLDSSPSLHKLGPQLERAAASEAPVLVVGEPGTGRTTLARALHQASPRAEGPLVEVDVAVIPSSLFESELFGHRAGAFTGAEVARVGRVARAENGVLLLDQVEELPVMVQPKLLRLLAEHVYSPLGGDDRRADVRFLTVASQELNERVERGAFRRDLYYRLEVLAFLLPPMRRRGQDLEPLARVMLEDLCERERRDPVSLAPTTVTWMKQYSWPGNLRQLRNLLERALVLHRGGALTVDPPAGAGTRRPRSLAEVEREAILDALAYTRGHQGRAAELLGISRKALWEKRRRFGLP